MGSGLQGVNTQKIFSLFLGCLPHRLSLGLSPGLVLVQHRIGGFPLSILLSPGLHVYSLAPQAWFSGPLARNMKFSQNSNHLHCHTIPHHWAYLRSKAPKTKRQKNEDLPHTIYTQRFFSKFFSPGGGFSQTFLSKALGL